MLRCPQSKQILRCFCPLEFMDSNAIVTTDLCPSRRPRRNRKRSKRRAIYCPIHGCYLDSTSQKHFLYADQSSQLRSRGYSHKNAVLVLGDRGTVSLSGEWLEEFWCNECQTKQWYYVQKQEKSYILTPAPRELWQNATGVVNSQGNPSVGEYTFRCASQSHLKSSRFNF